MKILFLDGTRGFTPTRLKEKPTGGIATSLTLLPRYLAQKGLDVSVMHQNNKGEVIEGVKYVQPPISNNCWDVVVFNRNLLNHSLVKGFESSRKIWWLHDIVDPDYLPDGSYRSMDDVVALSRYNQRSYADYYDIPITKFHIIPNGVDKTVFYPGTGKRDRNTYICASAPIKGLGALKFMLHNMRRHNPSFKLNMYVSQRLHDLENSSLQNSLLDELKALGADVREPIPQHDLAEEMRHAWALCMPNTYPENCSNIALQARACGLPVVSVPIGSMPEQVSHRVNGLLTETIPSDLHWHHKDFAVQCMNLYDEAGLQETLSANAPLGIHDWSSIGDRWFKLLTENKKWEAARASTISTAPGQTLADVRS